MKKLNLYLELTDLTIEFLDLLFICFGRLELLGDRNFLNCAKKPVFQLEIWLG